MKIRTDFTWKILSNILRILGTQNGNFTLAAFKNEETTNVTKQNNTRSQTPVESGLPVAREGLGYCLRHLPHPLEKTRLTSESFFSRFPGPRERWFPWESVGENSEAAKFSLQTTLSENCRTDSAMNLSGTRKIYKNSLGNSAGPWSTWQLRVSAGNRWKRGS